MVRRRFARATKSEIDEIAEGAFDTGLEIITDGFKDTLDNVGSKIEDAFYDGIDKKFGPEFSDAEIEEAVGKDIGDYLADLRNETVQYVFDNSREIVGWD